MTVASVCRGLCTAIVTLCLVLVAVVGTAPAQGAPAAGLRLEPGTAWVVSGGTVTLVLWMDDVEDLYRVEYHLHYDQAGLEVQDAEAQLGELVTRVAASHRIESVRMARPSLDDVFLHHTGRALRE